MNDNESFQSVSLQQLQLPESTLVTVKLKGTEEIISVPLSSIKLSPQLHGERIKRNKELQKLINVLNKHPTNKQSNQFIGLLHGSGGAGKSRVINAVRNYAKNLCNFLKVDFDKRTILTTALTGVAAVSINGEQHILPVKFQLIMTPSRSQKGKSMKIQ